LHPLDLRANLPAAISALHREANESSVGLNIAVSAYRPSNGGA